MWFRFRSFQILRRREPQRHRQPIIRTAVHLVRDVPSRFAANGVHIARNDLEGRRANTHAVAASCTQRERGHDLRRRRRRVNMRRDCTSSLKQLELVKGAKR